MLFRSILQLVFMLNVKFNLSFTSFLCNWHFHGSSFECGSYSELFWSVHNFWISVVFRKPSCLNPVSSYWCVGWHWKCSVQQEMLQITFFCRYHVQPPQVSFLFDLFFYSSLLHKSISMLEIVTLLVHSGVLCIMDKSSIEFTWSTWLSWSFMSIMSIISPVNMSCAKYMYCTHFKNLFKILMIRPNHKLFCI